LVLPHLPGDPKHQVVEPSPERIVQSLIQHGIANEAILWRRALVRATRQSTNSA
jgi:hypothetical protein